MKHRVEQERGRKYVGLPEFATVCERVVADLDLEQDRGTVTVVPDERTIRYYIAEGLIQALDEKQGTASVFSYLSLLQLVAVKKLQAEHFPIRKIRDLVAGKGEQELETLLGIGQQSKAKGNNAKQYLESLLTATPASSPNTMKVESAFKPARVPKRSTAVQSPQAPDAEAPSGSWQRIQIEPGLELHIRSDYSPPATSARTRSLAERVRSILNKWRS
ncbi:MAG TPA: MerR family transcriptional regulator [Pyrinomonadaceae bacterium]|nr:MerR family transcriptional regulator [Pyrinomonadaceae bacterium]